MGKKLGFGAELPGSHPHSTYWLHTLGEKIIAEARRVIQMEKEDAVRDIQRQVAVLSVEVARKILRRELSDEANQKTLIETYIDETLKQQ